MSCLVAPAVALESLLCEDLNLSHGTLGVHVAAAQRPLQQVHWPILSWGWNSGAGGAGSFPGSARILSVSACVPI